MGGGTLCKSLIPLGELSLCDLQGMDIWLKARGPLGSHSLNLGDLWGGGQQGSGHPWPGPGQEAPSGEEVGSSEVTSLSLLVTLLYWLHLHL